MMGCPTGGTSTILLLTVKAKPSSAPSDIAFFRADTSWMILHSRKKLQPSLPALRTTSLSGGFPGLPSTILCTAAICVPQRDMRKRCKWRMTCKIIQLRTVLLRMLPLLQPVLSCSLGLYTRRQASCLWKTQSTTSMPAQIMRFRPCCDCNTVCEMT